MYQLLAHSLGHLPRKTISHAARWLMHLRSPMAARRFIEIYGIDTEEAVTPPDGFASIHQVFTRHLVDGARPVDPRPRAMVCPVDGLVVGTGSLAPQPIAEGGRDGAISHNHEVYVPQAKGRSYSLAALLASAEEAADFEGGSVVSIYLSPRDYHRVHAPCDAHLYRWTYVPGHLFMVHPKVVHHIDAVYARNERLVMFMQSADVGKVVVVMVGSLLVGHLHMSLLPERSFNRTHQTIRTESYPCSARPQAIEHGHGQPPLYVGRGVELGWFEQGSTVLVVTEKPLNLRVQPGDRVRMGQALERQSA